MANYKQPGIPKQETVTQPGNTNGTCKILEDEYADLLPFPDGDNIGEPSDRLFRQQTAVSPSGEKLLPPHHVLVKCHLYDNPAKCRLWDKYQILKIAEEEAAELSRNSWFETAWLYDRVRQLETVLQENGILLPPEEEWPFDGHRVSSTDE